MKTPKEGYNQLPSYTRCSVCHSIGINAIGSTACCGGISEYLYEDELVSMGIDVSKTRNEGMVRPPQYLLKDL